ncbi:MAG: alpha-glucuronidase [Ignavibacteriales bacterium]|nr:alpha-glucuronidase [Ignavibacteriales bacterium]
MKFKIKFLFLLLFSLTIYAEDGYDLWLRYKQIDDIKLLEYYRNKVNNIMILGNSETIKIASEELVNGIEGLLGISNLQLNKEILEGTVLIGNYNNHDLINKYITKVETNSIGEEGYLIKTVKFENKKITIITANSDIGVLYGSFNFLRLIQTHKKINQLNIVNAPKIKLRVLNHWDNLDRTSERNYAGFSIWDWHKLPDFIDPRYIDYARANSSIGINGTVLTNVNANALVLTQEYLEKVKALADLFRPYGIRVYLTARFSAPIEIGDLETADPLNEEVQNWWNKKTDEIYDLIPDFGGFLVKANSEGQPGPQNYGRSHADGANMLAEVLEKHNGVVMWRAFVYSNENPDDRAKQAYTEFQPLDGKFKENVLIQVKNGPIDFQPREPFSPLFGAMPKTPLMMEFQITQEYLGQATHLVYLAPLFKECLNSDTYSKGKGSFVSKIINGSLDNHNISGIAGVANIGTDRNWTGHLFGQSNWYAFGRLAWDYDLTSEEIADEWIRMTFNNDKNVVEKISDIMLNSRENLVNYMTPLGLHHIMGWDHHYGPGPWIKDKPRTDWTAVYYHKADSNGVGFDRTKTGSNAVSQYFPEVAEKYSNLESCPEEYLLWFQHLSWYYKLKNGNTLWDELCYRYYNGANNVGSNIKVWNSLENKIDKGRFNHVKMLLGIQQKEANWWRDACVLYFQSFSKKEIPNELQKPKKSLEYFENLEYPYAPGIRPKW